MSPVQGRGGIFISYRRDEAGGHAGRLSDRLRDRFGADRVFMDVDDIPFGDDFTRVIEDKLSECDIMLVVIGRDWVSVADSKGRGRRIESTDDWVRVEVEAALQRGIRVVPVLVDGAKMPDAGYLPTSLQPLARRQAFVLSHTGYQSDLSRLIESIKRAPDDNDEVVEAEIVDEELGADLVGDWEARQGQGKRSYEPYESRRLDESERKPGPASKDREWRLDLVAGEGANKTFHLSSGTEVHEIIVRLTSMKGAAIGAIEADGFPVTSGSINGFTYSLGKVSSEVGTLVTITVSQGGPRLMRIDRVVVSIGPQDLEYRSKESRSRQSLDRGAQRINEWMSHAVETFGKRHR